jgi:hypothetical protein
MMKNPGQQKLLMGSVKPFVVLIYFDVKVGAKALSSMSMAGALSKAMILIMV